MSLDSVTHQLHMPKYTKGREAGNRQERWSDVQRCQTKNSRRGSLRSAFSQYASLLRSTISRRHRKRQECERRSARPRRREKRRGTTSNATTRKCKSVAVATSTPAKKPLGNQAPQIREFCCASRQAMSSWAKKVADRMAKDKERNCLVWDVPKIVWSRP